MNAIGAIILITLILVILCASRRWALIGVMAGVLFLTQGQQLQILGFNMYALRFLEMAAFFRVMSRREFSFSKPNRIDKALLLLYAYTTVVFLVRSSMGQANQIGIMIDACLCYFTFRGLIQDIDDFRWFLKKFVILLIPYVGLLVIERLTTHNLFNLIGGIDNAWLREGKIRCYGSFRHPSLLGTLGASFLAPYIALSLQKIDRKVAWLGMLLCLVIVWASNSGGPVNAAAVAIVGWGLWRFRTKMKLLRWSMVLGTIILALLMKAPIWYLLAKASSLTGGDGWHRSYLIDVSFQHLNLWWFAGMPLSDTADWFPYGLESTGGADITNQFLLFGLTAGLVSIGLFILLLTQAFMRVGLAMRIMRSDKDFSKGDEYMLWAMGVVIALHIVNWLGISYFDQSYAIWFIHLAVLANLSENCISVGDNVPRDHSAQEQAIA